jgi:hypothetical protein
MVDITIKIVDEAESIDLITLDEAKTTMGITTTDSAAQLRMMIDQASATIARLCNRVFAQEKRGTIPRRWQSPSLPLALAGQRGKISRSSRRRSAPR